MRVDGEYSREEQHGRTMHQASLGIMSCTHIRILHRGDLMAKTVRVLAGVVALPEKIEEVESLLHALIKETRKEAGCVQYELLQNRDDPAEFTFVEEWEDDSAIDAHFALICRPLFQRQHTCSR